MDENYHSIHKPVQHDQVRLVKFGHDGNQTSAVLEAFSLEGPIPNYYTLSYAWGLQKHVTGAIERHLLHIGKEEFPVLAALRSFFQVLGSKDADQLLSTGMVVTSLDFTGVRHLPRCLVLVRKANSQPPHCGGGSLVYRQVHVSCVQGRESRLSSRMESKTHT